MFSFPGIDSSPTVCIGVHAISAGSQTPFVAQFERFEVFSSSHALGPCATGNVGLGAGGPFDVLFVNGSAGGPARRVDVGLAAQISIMVTQPPTNPFSAPFAIFGYIGVPSAATVTVPPFNPGTMCFPPHPVDPNYPGTFTLVNALPPVNPFFFPALVSGGPTPWSFTASGLPFPFQLAFQGVIFSDPGTIRVTNGVLVNIE
jgi:hypothetical protein